MASSYVIRHDAKELFELSPAALWPEITDLHRFETWWSWLREATLEPDEVAAGSVLMFSIVTPLPYKMRCRVEFIDVVVGEKIETVVSGDLRGWATLEIEPHEDGSCVWFRWELEPTQGPMRMLVRVALPLILRTKDWAIDIALRAFRRNVERG